MIEIVCGWEPREALGYALCQFSAIRRTSEPLRFVPLMEKALRFQKLYRRPHEQRNGQAWDVISDAPMATSFACSRFLTPWLAEGDWALFHDGADMLWLADPAELFALADERYAVMVVKHQHEPTEQIKMDGQIQTTYARKNWSSVILWNRRHKANRRLTQVMVNTLPGRDLHRFCWLKDEEIGELPPWWNFLVGIDPALADLHGGKQALLHYTLGTPETGQDGGPWAEVWKRELSIMQASMNRVRA